jgi:hypothetical protein
MATKLVSTQCKKIKIRKVSPGDRRWGHDPGGRMDVKRNWKNYIDQINNIDVKIHINREIN